MENAPANRQGTGVDARMLGALIVVLVGVACSGTEPAPTIAAPASPAVQAATPAPSTEGQSPLPAVALGPRRTWRPIPVDRRSGIAQAFTASPVENRPNGLRRGWIVLNLTSPIPLPETGGQARSVAFLADYRCQDRAWHPMETVWYGQRNAMDEAFRERPRRPDQFGAVQTGTLVDVFLRAVCRI